MNFKLSQNPLPKLQDDWPPNDLQEGSPQFMRRAIQLAALGAGSVSPNPQVGAVIVYENRVIGEGYHRKYGYGTGCALVEVSRAGADFSARQVWRNTNLKNKFNSSVFHEGFVYGLDEGILTCIDAATGARRWKDGRYGYGQLLLAGGHLVLLGGEGELVLVRATPGKLAEISRFQASD